MSETPLTDEFAALLYSSHHLDEDDAIEFARRLERENQTLQQKLTALTLSEAAMREKLKGWRLVPIEATEEMRFAAHLVVADRTTKTYSRIWNAMLAAAPLPPTVENGS